MPVIKRYPNRKLYNTELKQYITLDRIADLIRSGQEVQVIDHVSGEDLTALTLTQIIVEQEKKQSGLVPRAVLTGLIQAGGERLNAIQRVLASPLSFWHQFDDEVRRRIQDLIKKGELTEKEGRGILEKMLSPSYSANKSHPASTEEIERILARSQVTSRAEFDQLLKQLDEISSKLDNIAE